MKKLTVQSSMHRYHVVIGNNIRFQLQQFIAKKYSAIMIITDETVARLYLEDVKQNFTDQPVYSVVVPSGEQSKSIEMYYHLQTKALENGLDRQSLIIALGGGVIGDLAGFVAATFLRGIDYVQIPTTILAHDSSVGGKVAINHELGKNLIGSFYPPQAVIYDVNTLATLNAHEVRSGYAELVKEALIADQSFFQTLMDTELKEISPAQLQEHLYAGIKIKADIVEADEKEAGDRMFLNLGHTLAHALEAELGYGKITHGEAVAIGLLFSMLVSKQFYESQLPYDELLTWLRKNNYPIYLPELAVDKIIQTMKRDKKVVQQTIQMVLLKQTGEPVVAEVSDEELAKYLTRFFRELVKT